MSIKLLNFKFFDSYKKGVSLYLVLIILGILFSVSLGLSSLLVKQLKMVRSVEESVLAFYAADSGIEKMLADPVADWNVSFPNHSSCVAQIRCSVSYIPCPFGDDKRDITCNAPRFCIKSKGIYNTTQRAIEVKY